MIEPETQAVVLQVCTVGGCEGTFQSGDVIGVDGRLYGDVRQQRGGAFASSVASEE